MPQWIEFEAAANQPPKTGRWNVVTKGGEKDVGGLHLGEIHWWGAWRTYAFFPAHASLFEATCLREIATFCEARTREHRERRSE